VGNRPTTLKDASLFFVIFEKRKDKKKKKSGTIINPLDSVSNLELRNFEH